MNPLFDNDEEEAQCSASAKLALEGQGVGVLGGGGGGGWRPPTSPWIEAAPPSITTGTVTEDKRCFGIDSDTSVPQQEVHIIDKVPGKPQLSSSTNKPPSSQETVANEYTGAPHPYLPQHQQHQNQHQCSGLRPSQPQPYTMPTLALPAIPPPPQQELLIKGNIPDVKIIPRPKFENATTSPSPAEDAAVWEAFLDLKRKTEGSVSRMTSFYEQVAKLQLTHEHEAAAYREVAESTISEQRKTIDTLSSDYTISVSNNESLQAILTKKTQQIMEYEKNTYDLNIRLKESEQKRAHLEDRATLAELGRKMAEIRQRELEMSLEHTTDLVKALRDHMSEFTRNKECALQEQYEMYEKNRRDVIDFYNEREKKVVQEFNETVKELQCIMTKAVNEREEYLSKCWREMMHTHQQQHDDAMREMILLRDKEEKDYQAKLIRMEQDKERWYDQYRNEMTLLEERHKERELHVLNDIARRERELGEREQRMRVQRSQEEQDAKVALMAKEAELKSYYQKITEDMRNDFDKERDKLTSSFRAQIQEISHLHLNNERELERMHRDKEREMAQRYRIAGYEVDDHKGEVALRGVSIQTEAALLSRFDAIEARQRERAEKARAALQSLPAGDSPPSDVGRL